MVLNTLMADLLQNSTLANSIDTDQMSHLIRIFTACNKIKNFLRILLSDKMY